MSSLLCYCFIFIVVRSLMFQVLVLLSVMCVGMTQAGIMDSVTSLMEVERRPQEEYDAFFKLVDTFLWDTEISDDEMVAEQRQYYAQFQGGLPLRRRGEIHTLQALDNDALACG